MNKVLLFVVCSLSLLACSKENKNNPFCGALSDRVEDFMDSVHSKIINISFFRKDNKDYAYIHNAYYFDTLRTDYYIETNGNYYREGVAFSYKRLITVDFGTYINHQDVFDSAKANRFEGKVPDGWPTDREVFDGCLKKKVFIIESRDNIQIIDSIPHTLITEPDNLSLYITNPYLAEELRNYIKLSETFMFYLVFFQYEGTKYVLIRGSYSYDKKHLKGFFFYQTALVVCYSFGNMYESFVNPEKLIVSYNGIIPGYKEKHEKYPLYYILKINSDGTLKRNENLDLRFDIIHELEKWFAPMNSRGQR